MITTAQAMHKIVEKITVRSLDIKFRQKSIYCNNCVIVSINALINAKLLLTEIIENCKKRNTTLTYLFDPVTTFCSLA